MPMVWSLSSQQVDFEERVRTLSLVTIALGVVAAALYILRAALLPLVVALALKHLLQPVIRALSVRPLVCCGRTVLNRPLACAPQSATTVAHGRGRRYMRAVCDYACRLQLPHTAAVVVSVLLAFGVLGLLAAIVADSVHIFAERADVYAKRVEDIVAYLLGWMEWLSCGWTPKGCPLPHNATGNATNATTPGDNEVARELEKLFSHISISDLVLKIAESLLETVSDLFVVCLFTIYLLLGKPPKGGPSKVDDQILEYIKGKLALSALIGLTTWLTLLACGLDLCLVFGVLAFWLNFVPNVGAVVAVLLPMPLVVLDPDIGLAARLVAFLVPFCVHNFVGNVLEPLVFGQSLELQPVVILLSLMVWGLLWDLTGMVLAVPLTAVFKIYLDSIDHPAAAFVVRLLVGDDAEDAEESPTARMSALPSVEDTAPHRNGPESAMEAASRPLVTSPPHAADDAA